MLLAMEVFRGVLVLRRIATAHVPAFHAQAQVHPAVALFQALFADMRIRARDFNLIEMRTVSHKPS